MLGHFEKTICGEVFDIGARPLFSYDLAPGEELREALSSFLRSFQADKNLFRMLRLSGNAKVEVQTGQRVKLFFQMNHMNEMDMENLLKLKKELEASGALKMVVSKHHKRVGLLGPAAEGKDSSVEAPINSDRLKENISGGVDA